MGRYEKNNFRQVKPRKRELHPVWRGIGCLIILVLPLMSYASAVIIVDYGISQRWPIPRELLGRPQLPEILFKLPSIAQIFYPVLGWINFYAYLAVGVIILVLLVGFLSFVYALMYRYVGPPQYSPIDAPPTGRKVKRYKR